VREAAAGLEPHLEPHPRDKSNYYKKKLILLLKIVLSFCIYCT
jgi:hypothetical protein